MITAIAIIAWIVYITDTNIHTKQLKAATLTELNKKETVEVVAVTPLDPKEPESATTSKTINDAIDRVGFVCCLTTMLFFAAPLSNLVSAV